MTKPAVWYELIKEEKHTGARLGILHTPHGSFGRYLGNHQGPVA